MNVKVILNLKEGSPMKRIIASLFAVILVLATAGASGFAANYDFKELTPEIRKALQNRQSRYRELQSLKQTGAIGENNKGYVTTLKEGTPSASTIASAENRDRRVIYEALAEQNALGSQGLLQVQKAFAEVQNDKASSGEMVQSASGDWKKK